MKIKVNNFFNNYAYLLIFVIAMVLRFWNLGLTPPSLYWDEVSQGYNSYSILKTGHDEHRELLPLARFQAFGDYKAPVYIYLDVIPIFLFGQSEFAIRFPSAFFGGLTVLLTYFLTLELSSFDRKKKLTAIFASFLLAISPWHIQLSRVAYEANVATFFSVLGIYLFMIAIRKNIYVLFFSAISFVLAFYSFNAHRIFIPLLLILLFLIFIKRIFKNIKTVSLIVLFSLVLLVPFFIYFQTPESKLRFREVNIFSDISIIEESNRLNADDENSLFGKVIHNRRVLYGLSYIKHYFDFFNPSYLFFSGDINPRFSTRDTGQLYLITLPFILLGLYYVTKKSGKEKFILLGWFLLAPIAAATARETPHALRSETFIPTYEIIAAIGLVFFFNLIRQYKRVYFLSFAVLGIVLLFNLIQFLHAYYIHMPNKYSQDWQYGYKEAVESVESIIENYDKVIFSNIYGRAYIYILWYGKYEPEYFWNKGIVERDEFGFYNVKSFDKYNFQTPNSYKPLSDEKVLYVGQRSEIPRDSRVLKYINFLDDEVAFILADNIK